MKSYKVWLIAAALWCVILAVTDFQSTWIYQLSRWAVCSVAVWSCFHFDGWHRLLMYAVAVIFNPIVPLHFGQDGWRAVDWLSAGCFMMTALWGANWIKYAWKNRAEIGGIAFASCVLLGGIWLVCCLIFGDRSGHQSSLTAKEQRMENIRKKNFEKVVESVIDRTRYDAPAPDFSYLKDHLNNLEHGK